MYEIKEFYISEDELVTTSFLKVIQFLESKGVDEDGAVKVGNCAIVHTHTYLTH